MENERIGRFVCLLLRHKPEVGGLTLDAHGWTSATALVSAVNNRPGLGPFTLNDLETLVREDSKSRYEYDAGNDRIRATQGHSVNIDADLKEVVPPDILYHGTAQRHVESIKGVGIVSKSRLYVHLSTTRDTAVMVGSRHGSPAVLTVDAGAMHSAGIKFYRAENGDEHTVLTTFVAPEYIKEETCDAES